MTQNIIHKLMVTSLLFHIIVHPKLKVLVTGCVDDFPGSSCEKCLGSSFVHEIFYSDLAIIM